MAGGKVPKSKNFPLKNFCTLTSLEKKDENLGDELIHMLFNSFYLHQLLPTVITTTFGFWKWLQFLSSIPKWEGMLLSPDLGV